MRLLQLTNLVRAFNETQRRSPLGLISLKEELLRRGLKKEYDFLDATYSRNGDLSVREGYRYFFPINDDYQLRPGRGCEVIYVGDLAKFKQTASYYFDYYLIDELILSKWTPAHGYFIRIPEWKFVSKLTITTELSPGRVSALKYIALDHLNALTIHLEKLDKFVANELINLKLKATEITLVTKQDETEFVDFEALMNNYNIKIRRNNYALQNIG